MVDSNLTVSSGSDLNGATVYIEDGFSSGDTLSFTDKLGITGSYNATSGVLTLSGTTNAANYQEALRTVEFFTTSSELTERKIIFSLGQNSLYYSGNGHYYEYISSNAITWDTAFANAASRTLYGMQGYLVRNNFV